MSVEALFEALAGRKPGEVILSNGASSLDATAMIDAIASLRKHLAGTRVLAVLADNSPAWVAADLAALQTRTVHLPLPGFFSAAQMAHALDETGADALLTDQPERIKSLDLGFAAAETWHGLVLMRRVVDAVTLPAGTAKVSFTSGSTGTPKGVCLSAVGLMDTARAVAARLADLPIERHLAVLPLALLLENVAGVYAPLLRGAAVHLPALSALGWRGMSGFDPAALHATASAARAQSMILVPELLKAWTLYLAAHGLRAPADAVYVAVGGARVDPELLARARGLGLPAYQGYGLTECGSVVSMNRPGDDGVGGDDAGRPLDHAGVRIEAGEVRVATRAFLGYLNGAGADAEFATGDLGEFDASGHLRLSGRSKNLLITSFGRNVAPEWVEAALLAEPAIGQAVVAGDARPWLAAILVPASGTDGAALKAAVARVNRGLPAYARIGEWLAAAPFTPQNGQATGNGRPVRTRILNHYAAALAVLYSQKESAHVVL